MASRSYTVSSKTAPGKRGHSDSPASSQPAKKRKSTSRNKTVNYYDDNDDDNCAGTTYNEFEEAAAQAALARLTESKPKRARKTKGEEPEEKRLRRFRVKAPATYTERLYRVRTQRMFLIDRTAGTSDDGSPEEEFDIAGTTGNIYQVKIGKVPTCSCPDNEKGNQCKHIIYVLVNVLKARADLAYQLAFLSTELHEIFATAPSTPQASDAPSSTTDTGGKRKPIDGDCPVCVMEFEEAENVRGEIVWCKAACGQNVHRRCFEQWAKAKPGEIRCVFCRTPWKGDEDMVKRINKKGPVNSEGYVNVAGELGLSGHRDMSTYHPYWVEQQRGYGGYRGYRGYRGY